MIRFVQLLGMVFLSGLFSFKQSQADMKVVVSIRPLYGLVYALMKDVHEPQLLLEGHESPHTYALKPGDVEKMSQADLFVWVGPSYEAFLVKAVKQKVSSHALVTAQNINGITLYPLRSGELWAQPEHSSAHSHNGHAHSYDVHSHSSSHAHSQDEHQKGVDGHLWLDVANMRLVAVQVCEKLKLIDPAHADQYSANLYQFLEELKALDVFLREKAKSYQNLGFIVFHDSYQYLEKYLNIKMLGSILLEPDVPAQAYHIDRLLKVLHARQCQCIFSEPQFSADLAQSLGQKANVKVGTLDPLGTNVPLSEKHYFYLMKGLLTSIDHCL